MVFLFMTRNDDLDNEHQRVECADQLVLLKHFFIHYLLLIDIIEKLCELCQLFM